MKDFLLFGFLEGESRMMQAPPEITCVSVSVPVTSKSMRIPLQLIVPLHTLKTIDSYALIDSSADISCINYDFVKKHHLPVSKLEDPICSRNANGSLNKKGDIRYSCTLFINIKGITQKVVFHVMSLKDNIILGLPWLRPSHQLD